MNYVKKLLKANWLLIVGIFILISALAVLLILYFRNTKTLEFFTVQQEYYIEFEENTYLKTSVKCSRKDTMYLDEGEKNPTTSVSIYCDSEQGTVSGAGEYEPGSWVTITATPNVGYKFAYWFDKANDNTYYENPYTFRVDTSDCYIEAVFERAKVLVDGIYYYLNADGTAIVTSPDEYSYYGDIVIPETGNGGIVYG